LWPFSLPRLSDAVGLFVRLGLEESPVFAELLRAPAARRTPVVDLLRANGRTVLLAAGSYLSITATGYLLIVYFVSYATRELQLSLATTLA
jgi:hypothetical protein